MGGHQLRGFAEKGDAVLPGEVVPNGESLFGRSDRASRVFPRRKLKFAEHQPSVRRSDVREVAIARIDRMAVDEEGMRLAEAFLLMGKRRFKGTVKIFPKICQRGVLYLFHRDSPLMLPYASAADRANFGCSQNSSAAAVNRRSRKL